MFDANAKLSPSASKALLALFLWVAAGETSATEPPSTCVGTSEQGRLLHGWKLPTEGANYTVYSSAGAMLGRTYVHSSVYEVMIASYAALETSQPNKLYVYGETGKAGGGPFKPHKTHQNGLSVDFMVPVVDEKGRSVALPSTPFNKFGYDIEFSVKGTFENLRIDFDALASHLLTLKQAAAARGIGIRRVIFDNDLQKLLFASKDGAQVKQFLTFSKKKPWVRHDEHYHVDFDISCTK